MSKNKTITTVKAHYIGEETIQEKFTSIIKNQMEQILLEDNKNHDKSLTDNKDYDTISYSKLLSEREDLC